MEIVDLDSETMLIDSILFGEERPCSFSYDWKSSPDGRLSEAIRADGMAILDDYRRIALSHGVEPSSVAGIATEVFRKSSNGAEYLEQIRSSLGFKINLISQQVEAELGFMTAAAFDGKDAVAWDSGGGSFQITAQDGSGKLQTYLGALGTGIVASICVVDVQGSNLMDKPSPNPCSMEEVEQLVGLLKTGGRLPLEPPAWISDAPVVTAIGGPNSIFALACKIAPPSAGREGHVDLAGVKEAITKVAGKEDHELAQYSGFAYADPAKFVVTKLALLRATMEHCQMQAFRFQPAVGSCPGLLVHPKFDEFTGVMAGASDKRGAEAVDEAAEAAQPDCRHSARGRGRGLGLRQAVGYGRDVES